MKLTLYVPGDTWLHRLDPVTKLALAGAGVALTFALSSIEGGVALFGVLLLMFATGGVIRTAWPVFIGVGLVALTFVIVQGLVHGGNANVWLHLGPVTLYREGVLVGVRLALRLYNILSAALTLVLTTNPSDLTESVVRRGLSPRAGYVIMAMLQIIPTMVGSTAAITDAQRSRGMETEGGLWTRVRAFVPLLGPLVTSSLIATEERALALEVRGFGGSGRPTFLRDERVPDYATTVRWLAALVCAAGIAARVRWGL